MAQYLSVADVIALHNRVLERMDSGFAPLRDEGLLESAVMKPQTAAYYEGADLIRQVALLAIGISQNQPFVDGNKRTAFLSLVEFLGLNGFRLAQGQHMELARQLGIVAERTGTLGEATDAFESWLRAHVVERAQP
jgi:death-on-curing protein